MPSSLLSTLDVQRTVASVPDGAVVLTLKLHTDDLEPNEDWLGLTAFTPNRRVIFLSVNEYTTRFNGTRHVPKEKFYGITLAHEMGHWAGIYGHPSNLFCPDYFIMKERTYSYVTQRAEPSWMVAITDDERIYFENPTPRLLMDGQLFTLDGLYEEFDYFPMPEYPRGW